MRGFFQALLGLMAPPTRALPGAGPPCRRHLEVTQDPSPRQVRVNMQAASLRLVTGRINQKTAQRAVALIDGAQELMHVVKVLFNLSMLHQVLHDHAASLSHRLGGLLKVREDLVGAASRVVKFVGNVLRLSLRSSSAFLLMLSRFLLPSDTVFQVVRQVPLVSSLKTLATRTMVSLQFSTVLMSLS